MQATHEAHRKAALWLLAIVGTVVLLLAAPAIGRADESNPNNLNCLGKISAGTAEEGSEEQQVAYSFYCNGPITGYQLQAQVPVTGISSVPVVTTVATGGVAGTPLKDTFGCSGELPGWALNCVGAAKAGYEMIAGQFAIGRKLCVEPRVDPLLTVTSATIEKGAVVQAISGPFDLGRPQGCPPDAYSGDTRLNPKPLELSHKKKGKKGSTQKKSSGKKARRSAHRAAAKR